MTEDTLVPFDLPAVNRKKVSADFSGGSIWSEGGLVLLRAAERRLGLAETLAGCIREWRDPARAVQTLPAMLRFRLFAIACGYEDVDDCDGLRTDPLFKVAYGRVAATGSRGTGGGQECAGDLRCVVGRATGRKARSPPGRLYRPPWMRPLDRRTRRRAIPARHRLEMAAERVARLAPACRPIGQYGSGL